MKRTISCVAATFVVLLCVRVSEAQVACLLDISTGYDQTAGAVLAEGSLDDDYTVDGQPVPTGGAGQGFPVPPWVANSARSLWISPSADSVAAPGPYAFELRFDVPAETAAGRLVLSGFFTADDGLSDVIINGTSTGLTAGGFNILSAIPARAGLGLFQTGENVIRFLVTNGGEAANPCGLRVEGCIGLLPVEQWPFDISTGFDRAALDTLPNGADDPAYTIAGPDGIGPKPAVVINDDAFPIPPWLASSVQSKWIGAQAGSVGPVGPYVYAIDVTLPSEVEAEFASISGGFAADDEVTDVVVNGVSTGIAGAGFGALVPFPVGAGRGLFQGGANTIEFLVSNGGEDPGPTGLRVEGQVLACLEPEEEPPTVPASLVLDTGRSDADGALLPTGAADDTYEIILPVGSEVCRTPAVVIDDTVFPVGPWLATSELSKWISPAVDSNGPPGVYGYRVRVNVPPELDATTLKLIGAWSSDNTGLDVRVNGASTGSTHDGNFTVLHAFPQDAGLGLFQTGENIVDFIVENLPPGAGPTGLRVEGVVGAGTAPRDLSTGHAPRGIGPAPVGFPEGRYGASAGEEALAAEILDPLAGWVANAPTSKWIGVDGAEGDVTYSLAFDLGPGVNPDRAVLSGAFTSSPPGAQAFLDGESIGTSVDPGTLTPLADARRLFVGRTNTLTFVVPRADSGPTAIVVDAVWETVAPEPHPLDISTGLDETTGNAILPGTADDRYVLQDPEGAQAPAVVVTGAPIPPWIPNTASAGWIGNANPASEAPAGDFVFRTVVTLTADQAASAYLSGGFAADDAVLDVRVNDQPTGIQSQFGFGALTFFAPDAGKGLFEEGENTIEFVVQNGGPSPFGLFVDAVVSVPPPPGGLQRPGDCNQDGNLDISDGICLLGFLFLGSPAELPCEGGAPADEGNRVLLDGNDDGVVDLSDAIAVFGYLFLGTAPPVLGTDCVRIPGCPDACVPEG